MAAAGQLGEHLGGEPGRVAMMNRHPVAPLRERPRHRPADAPGCPGDQDRPRHTRHLASQRDSSLAAVAQFLAVAATLVLPELPTIRNSTWASSLFPKPSGVCRNRARPIAWMVSRPPLTAAALCAAAIRSSRSCGGSAFRNTTCTSLGFGSSGYGLSRRT